MRHTCKINSARINMYWLRPVVTISDWADRNSFECNWTDGSVFGACQKLESHVNELSQHFLRHRIPHLKYTFETETKEPRQKTGKRSTKKMVWQRKRYFQCTLHDERSRGFTSALRVTSVEYRNWAGYLLPRTAQEFANTIHRAGTHVIFTDLWFRAWQICWRIWRNSLSTCPTYFYFLLFSFALCHRVFHSM